MFISSFCAVLIQALHHAGFAHQVAQHQHADQRRSRGQQQRNKDRYDDGEA